MPNGERRIAEPLKSVQAFDIRIWPLRPLSDSSGFVIFKVGASFNWQDPGLWILL